MDPSFGLGRQYLQGHRFEYDTMKTVMSCGRKMQETPESLVTLGAKLVAISLCLTILHLSPAACREWLVDTTRLGGRQ